MSPIRKLRARPAPELARATIALAIARVGVRALPFRVLARLLGLRDGQSTDTLDADTERRAAQVGRAVQQAAAHVPWRTTCLMQALAAAALLRRRDIDATLYLGVANASDTMVAHAWLRCGSLVLTGAGERDRFTPIASLAMHGSTR